MATLTQMRDAIKDVVGDNISSLRVHETIPDITEGHCVVVIPDSANFAKTFQRGMDEWTFNLYVVIAWQDTTVTQDKLDPYLSGAGTKSIRQVIHNNPTLGGVVDDCYVRGMRGYGGSFELAKVRHIGAIIDLTVLTSGTS
jgi:hypothetical protein